jgi:hypothetical protein
VSYLAAPGQVNGVTATSDAFRITGVVVLPGIAAPTAAQSPLIMRPYDQELMTCKRYYETLAFPVSGTPQAFPSWFMTSTFFYHYWKFYAQKRAAPTITFGGTWTNATPTISPGLDGVLFNNGSGYFYLLLSGGQTAASADARL